ncbi:MAG: protein kinase, partial [Planctomycetes bacterium]|nr:protein kinase [Planctomycetota bacterium]
MDGGFDLDALLRPVRAQRADPTGQVLSGCRLERVLGRGAMGEAWLARREADGQPVVVKLLDPVALADAERRARARREWATLCKVRPTPHVVQVLGVDLEHERPHLVLELVPGEGLHALLRRRGRLPWSDAARVARDLALGLAAVHEQGVVHRDVKPANAIVRPDGAATLVDFGLAKDLFATSVTSPQMILGTAAYMAPEQWADAATRDGRCDLFALGATLYELVAGAPPFGAGQDPAAVEEAATTGDYAPLEEAAPGAPAELALVVDLLLAPDPAWRYPRADLAARDLEAVLRGGACSAPCLLAADGRRWPLVRGRRWTLGSAPDCQVPLPPPASPRHAQLRREAAGYTLVDLRGSAGTRVQGAPLAGPRALAPGDALDLAGVALRFVDPLRTAPVAATEVVDARREVAPAPLVQALAAE